MAKFAAIVLAAFAFHAALAAPQQGNKQLEEVASQIQNVANDISATIQKALPDSKTIAAQAQDFSKKVDDITKKFQAELDSNQGKLDDQLKEFSGKLGEIVHSLQELSGPEATGKVNEMRTKFEADVKSAAAEFEKLGKAVEPSLQQAGDSVQTFLKDVYGDFLKATQTLQTNVDKAVNKN